MRAEHCRPDDWAEELLSTIWEEPNLGKADPTLAGTEVEAERKEKFRVNWLKARKLWAKSDSALAREAKVARETFGRWEKEGVSIDKGDTVTKVCRVLGIVPESMWEKTFRMEEQSSTTITALAEHIRSEAHRKLDKLLQSDDNVAIVRVIESMYETASQRR